MLPTENVLEPDEQYTMFHPSELELTQTTLKILGEVERIEPTRVVFVSLSELRPLAGKAPARDARLSATRRP
jgi:circadian clock protein KaiC